MGRPLRFVPPESVVEVTTRTIHGRKLLRPSSELNDVLLGVLGRAQRLFGVAIHAFVAMSNHMHMLLTVRDAAQLASFMGFVNGNIAREAGRLNDWPERFWGRRYRAIVVADEQSQVDRMRYILSNGTKEGLVASPKSWPGISSFAASVYGEPLLGTWHDRTSEYRTRHRARGGVSSSAGEFTTLYAVTVTPIPCWSRLAPMEYRKACATLVAGRGSSDALAKDGERNAPLGIESILACDPHEKPVHCKRSPAPFVHAVDASVRRAFRAAYDAFVSAYRASAAKLRKGDRTVAFPPAAFPPRLPFTAEPVACMPA